MSRRSLVASLALCLLAVAPAVTASGWGAKGQHEPDTKLDATGGWMWLSADIDPNPSVRAVYFNGWHGNGVAGGPDTSNSLNLATVRSQIYYGEGYNFEALLGVWKDCNNDGYMGLGDQGLLEYRSTLLLSDSICKAEADPAPIPKDWFPSHNDGTWVRELLPIAWRDVRPGCTQYGGQPDCNPYNVNDNGARVWADYGRPGTWTLPSLSCWWPLPADMPRGSTHSTGGFLEYMDCWGGGRLTSTIDTVADLTPATRPYSFEDHPTDPHNSASKANVANPWGNERDSNSYVQAWDCSKPTTHVAQATNTQQVNVSQPKLPPGVSTTGSLAGTANATGSGFDRCSPSPLNNGYSHWGSSAASAPYFMEADVVNPTIKNTPDGTLAPVEDSRPSAPWALAFGKSAPNMADTAGAHLTDDAGFWTEGLQREEAPVLNSRDDITPVVYNTFYAFVSPTAISTYGLAMPKGTATGTYGVEACGGYSSGIHNSWSCDATQWYKDAYGKDIDPRSARLGQDPSSPFDCSTDTRGCVAFGSPLGAPYDLRDVDCYDQSVQRAREAGVSWGKLTGTACDEAP